MFNFQVDIISIQAQYWNEGIVNQLLYIEDTDVVTDEQIYNQA
jgi:hypothetical protein